MGRIPDEVIAEIRDRSDIVAVIGETVALKKTGNAWKGLCPFHGERTPSFSVSQEKRAYYCFGCQAKGDVFRFICEMKGLTFIEAIKELANRAGILLPEKPESEAEQKLRSERSRLLEVNLAATTFYRGLLGDELAGQRGREYLDARGIGAEISESFKLGLAPDAWDSLARNLAGRKVPVEHALALGLVAPRKSGDGFYDKFRDRLMCPVILPAGEIVGFSGRTLGSDPETPKYVNSSESFVYKKSHLLFGLHAARPAFARKHRALLVEGNFDVIALHQAGFAEAVAPLGTALTSEQVDRLQRLAPSVILCMDGDRAGRAAALKDIQLCVAAGLDTRVATLPDGEDPDSFVRKRGAAEFEALLGRAMPAVEHFLEHLWFRSDRSVDSRTRALHEAAPLIACVHDEIKRSMIIDQFAKAMGAASNLVRAEAQRAMVRAQGSGPVSAAPAPSPTTTLPPPPNAELQLIALLSDHPSLLPNAEELSVRSLLTDPRLRDMYSAALSGSSFLESAPPELSDTVAKVVFAGEYRRIEDPRRTLSNMVRGLSAAHQKRELAEVKSQLQDAERRGDLALARELSARQVRLKVMTGRPEEEPR
jgi:DNA primase